MSAKPKPTPHNPDNVTPAQLNPRKGGKGWRLLDADEIKYERDAFGCCEAWSGSRWLKGGFAGCFADRTYRTRLTRAELAKLK